MLKSDSVKQIHVQRLRKASAVMIAAIGVYLLMSLFSYSPNDPSWANTQPLADTNNLGGIIGAWTAYTAYFALGYAAYLLVFAVFFSTYLLFQQQVSSVPHLITHITRWIGYSFIAIALCGLLTMHFKSRNMPVSAGGWIGELTARGFTNIFGDVGTTLLLFALLLGSLHLVVNISWLKIMEAVGAVLLHITQYAVETFHRLREWKLKKKSLGQRRIEVTRKQKKLSKVQQQARRIEPSVGAIKTSGRKAREKQIPLFADHKADILPPLAILSENNTKTAHFSEQSLEAMANQLEAKLADFKIEGKVVKVQTGPVVTCFELSPAPGTKARQLTNLEKDLARALSMPSVRVVEVIPGKAVIGIEIPNEVRETVLLKEILDSEAYDKAKSPLAIALGKDTSGNSMIVDLQKTPHLLVAGTTGSGKSVAVHSMLMSILFKASPQEVRFILIDPKMLELNAYEGIPHLLTPVITDMKEATTALRWAVVEMDRRYEQMSNVGVRNLEAYNQKVKPMQKEGTSTSRGNGGGDTEAATEELLERMPYIVVVIDEFADIMMVVGKPVEDLITRLAQKARAAGIHLIIATQRPSVNVITGLIKANIPSRIAFQVSSKIDSRTILDQNGADQLLGQGDMLYLGPGYSIPTRVHGAFVSDSEVKDTVAHWSKQGEILHIDFSEFVKGQDGGRQADEYEDSMHDELYATAIDIVKSTQKASISYIQRRLKVGYNRAARMVERMEEEGIVSAVQSNGKREVLDANPKD